VKRLAFSILLVFFAACAGLAAEASPPERIISLAPSMTEILYALGLGDNIMGVTTFCDYPEEAKKKPKIGGMSNPSLEAVLTLEPDVVVMTTDGNPKEFEERLLSLNIKTYVFEARTLSELPKGIRELGKAMHVADRANRLAGDIERKIAAISKSRAQGLERKKVLYIVWPEPLIAAGPGTAIDDAIGLLGLENIAHHAVMTYPKYSLEEVIRAMPDILVIGKGSGMDMLAVSQGLLKRLAIVPAVRNNRVCYVGDGLYRLGPRVVAGIEELAECFGRN
jgi:iron complex transport system substrate-binding protein